MEGPRLRGRPTGVFRHIYCELLKVKEETQPHVWLDERFDYAQEMNKWSTMVHDFNLTDPHPDIQEDSQPNMTSYFSCLCQWRHGSQPGLYIYVYNHG